MLTPVEQNVLERIGPGRYYNRLLTCEVGSTSHGMSVEGQDDMDWLGIYLEEPHEILGLGKADTIVLRDRPDGVRSEPGDLDYTLHPLKKWMGLAMRGNPTILSVLFAPVVQKTEWGEVLRSASDKFVSYRAGRAFLGYLDSQTTRLIENRSMRVNRPELVEKYGYDTKYAAHALRLGLQGWELLTYGSIRYPMESPYLELVRSVRTGELSKSSALERIGDARSALADALNDPSVRPEPNWEWANYFLQHVYLSSWADEAGGYA